MTETEPRSIIIIIIIATITIIIYIVYYVLVPQNCKLVRVKAVGVSISCLSFTN